MTGTKNILKVATYNVHSWRGMDRVVSPQRVLGVAASLGPDIVALQEAVSLSRTGSPCSLTELAEAMGYHVIFGSTMLRSDSRYGNALLSKRQPEHVEYHTLECPGREPRGALEGFFDINGVPFKVLATHLGLNRQARNCQLEKLLSAFVRQDADVTLLMGDMNEWLPWGRVLRRLRGTFGGSVACRTFPSVWPALALDRIYVRPVHRLISLHAVRSPITRVASDHLPLVAEVDVSPG